MLLLVIPSEKIDEVVEIINETAFTGNFGDGKIFISPVEEAYTVRTRTKGL
jgi:nitrogen regulatory protein PII 1